MKFNPKQVYLSLVLSLLFCASVSSQIVRPSLTAREIAQKTLPSVVIVVVKNSSGKVQGFGSGFFVRSDIVATNYHVIDDATQTSQLFIRFPKSKLEYKVLRLSAIHVKDDLALLNVGNFGQSVTPLALGESYKMAVGDVVYAAGNPEGLTGTFSQGIISGRRQINEAWYIQISAPISHGSSGGPVLNENGEVIGVAAAGLEEGQNLNFAVPSSSLKSLMGRSVDSIDPRQRDLNESLAEWYLETKGKSESETSQQSGGVRGGVPGGMSAVSDGYLKQGIELFQKDKYKEAVEYFKLAIQARPENARAHYYIGLCRSLMGGKGDGIEDLKVAVSIEPDFARAHYVLGIIYFFLNEKPLALEEYKILKTLDTDMANDLFKRMYK
jgi:tetratricopeptide (TPR) repeat protein